MQKWIRSLMVFLIGTISCQSMANDVSADIQAELDRQCEIARERKLEPLRNDLIAECAAKPMKKEDYCVRFYATYGDAIVYPNGVIEPKMFYGIPECVEAFDYGK